MRLEIASLRKRAQLGCTEEERSFPQTISLDLVLELDAPSCVMTDELNDTVDYISVVRVIDRLCAECEWKLIEKLCFDFGREIVALSPVITHVDVKVTKQILAESSGVSAALRVFQDGTFC